MLHSENQIELCNYRLIKAKESLNAAKLLLDAQAYGDSANRSYYALFHATNALFALRDIGFKKHSGVIACFNKDYVKTGIIEVEYGKMLGDAFNLRTETDYRDFYIVAKEDVEIQYRNAVRFIERIEKFVLTEIDK